MHFARCQSAAEDGAVAITTAILLTVLVLMAAIVIDIGYLRIEHRDSQTVVDMAVAAGGFELGQSSDREAACNMAWSYVVNNLDEVADNEPQPGGHNCSTQFSGTCDNDPLVPADVMDVPLAGGDIRVIITMPVHELHHTMQPTRQALEPDRDGTPCERIAVEIRRTRTHTLAGVAGFEEGSSLASAVARRMNVGDAGRFVSLVVLDRGHCQTIRANGGGTMEVANYVDPLTGQVHPGTITVDSAPPSCGSQKVFDLDGGGTRITAEGEIFSYGLGEGGTPPDSVYYNSDVTSGKLSPRPEPGPLVRRDTIDHRYNCESTEDRYDESGDEPFRPVTTFVTDPSISHPGVPACGNPQSSYILDLYEFVSGAIDDVEDDDDDGFVDNNAPDGQTAAEEFAAAGFEVYGDNEAGEDVNGNGVLDPGEDTNGNGVLDPPEPCNDANVVSAPTQIKWYFDCATTRIRGGDEINIHTAEMVVFRGGVDVDAGTPTGILTTNSAFPTTGTNTSAAPDAAVVIWDGDLQVQGQINATRSFVYINTGTLDKTGGGNLFMTPPCGGPAPCTPDVPEESPACSTGGAYPTPSCFEDLSIWQNGFGTSPSDKFNLGGNGGLTIVGSIFVPNALVHVHGTGFTDLDAAQFFAWRFEYTGSSGLTLLPNPENASETPLFGAGLIR